MRLSSSVLPTSWQAGFFIAHLVLLASAPAFAATLTVCAAGCTYNNLQHALEAAQPGDTILLRAGETFVGHFRLPVKSNPSGAFIVVRSDAPDSALPAAGTRLIPHGYPGGNTDRGALARLVGRGGDWKTTPVIGTEPGAHHYRLQFLDIDGVAQEGWETLVQIGDSSWAQSTAEAVPYAITLDRVFIHGHETKGQKRCVALDGRDLEVLNSYVVGCASIDFDSQAIAAFNGPGPFRIINNYLEATGENVMFGGADPKIQGLVPSDIEIRRNHFYKPLAWRDPILAAPSMPSGAAAGGGSLPAGTHYFKVVAVLQSASEPGFSAPSPERAVSTGADGAVTLTWSAVPGADRYRIYYGTSSGEQNRYIETSGSGTSFTYRGSGETWHTPWAHGTRWNIKNLLELKNAQRVLIDGNVFEHNWAASQRGYAILFTPRNEEGGAPWSVVQDVTFSNNVLRHAAGGINILGDDYVRPSQRTRRIAVRNNLVYDLSSRWGDDSHFLLMTRSPDDITVDHNTVFHQGMVVLVDDGTVYGFSFTNNVAPHNTYGIFGSSAGIGTSAINAYFPGAVVRRNALGGGPAVSYPPDNFFPDMPTFSSQFVDPGSHDYRLVSGSSFSGAGTDGRDLGVDFAALNSAISGVVAGGGSGPGGGDTGGGGGSGGGDGSGGDAGSGGGSGVSTPFTGTPLALPGIIQAEDFDQGGTGVAYYDTTGGNFGGEYRSTDVDIEATWDSGGGYNVGWLEPGEWLKYTVNIASAGTYTIDVRVASTTAGGTFHIEIDGVDQTGPITIPATGGWQSWTTVTRTGVQLSAGRQVWAVVIDSRGTDGAVGNINYIRVSTSSGGGDGAGSGGGSTPFAGTPLALPGTIQAEDFDNGGQHVAYYDNSAGNQGGSYRAGDVDIAPAEDTGGGYTLGWVGAGEWLNYTVNVAAAGTYDIEVRVASAGAGGTFHIEVNGVDRTGPLSVPNTGGWQTWSTVRHAGMNLAAGTQVWRLVMASNGAATGAVGNFNYIRVVGAASQPSPGGGGDIVLYASNVGTTAGNWSRVGSWSGAEGEKMQSVDRGWSTTDWPLPAPADYFEAQFTPEAHRPYRVWLRLRAGGDSKFNDSVWVQFSGAVDLNGAPAWQIGSGAALLVNLEACADCGVTDWGWHNGAWWLEQSTVVQFPSTDRQTVRIQTREDGVEVDQIILSPATYFHAAPGGRRSDTTIVPKP
jgi:hypothetical protein